MPYKDPAAQREYQRRWVAARRANVLAEQSCVDCGSTRDLEFDHRDPAQKVDHRMWSWSPARLAAELSKCDIRCRACHTAKHAEQRRSHGAGGYKRGCRCEICRAWKRQAAARQRTALGDAA